MTLYCTAFLCATLHFTVLALALDDIKPCMALHSITYVDVNSVYSCIRTQLRIVMLLLCQGVYTYIYIYMLPPPSVIYLFRGFPGHAGEHVPKTRGHVQFLIRARVYRLWHCAVRIVFI